MTFGSEPLEERVGETLVAQRVSLDGHYFRRCRIERCEVHYAGGNWGYDATQFIECSYVFSARALFILESAACIMGFDAWEQLFDKLRAAPPPKAH